MSSYVQLLSFFISFIFGVVFYLFARFNKVILCNRNNIIKLLVTLVFIIDAVILYVVLMYKINLGVMHPYFVFTLILGFIFGYKFFDKCKECVKRIKLFK